jgi:type I restriction enzyme M protein
MLPGIFMIDASDGFMKDGPKNRLRSQDIHKIVDAFNRRQEIPGYSKIVSFEEIERNEFNLNLPRYIDSRQAEDIHDIAGHLQGGIPVADVDSLSRYWQVCPALRHALFTDNRPGYVDLAVDKSDIKSSIYEHPEFATFIDEMNQHFNQWRQRVAAQLRGLTVGCHPKQIIGDLSEDLLAHYSSEPNALASGDGTAKPEASAFGSQKSLSLINHYDVYQHLMDYWSDVMQDDVYQIAAEGWKAETYRILVKDNKGKERDKGWACDLIPKPLIVSRYFADQQAAIDRLQAELENVLAQQTELEEEHGGEEGVFGELDKINKATVTARLKEIKDESSSMGPRPVQTKSIAASAEQHPLEQTHGPGAHATEEQVLKRWLKHSAKEAQLKKQIKDAEAQLDAAAYGKYPGLTEDEVKSLVVDAKWLTRLDADVHGEMDRISQSLTQRVKELAERYEATLPQLSGRVADLEERVNGHLERMGFGAAEPKLAEVGT